MLSSLLLLSTTVIATPNLNYAFNNQLPPLARYNEEYNYQLSSDSFTTDDSWMDLWAEGLPDWLKFDGDSSTLSGTPQPQDNNNEDDQTISFRILAKDSSGQAYCDCTLLVTNIAAPEQHRELTDVLKDSGKIAGNDNLVLAPGQGFEINFSPDYYQKSDGGRDISGYYGKMADHAPLPNWLNFDQDEAKFYGTAPSVNSEIAPAQEFSVAMLVSDYNGFSSNEAKFNLLVGAHQFTTNLTIDNINATRGKNIRYQIPFDKILLDNNPVEMANISSITLNTTESSWLKLDNSTGVITGTPPKSLKEDDQVKVQITDTHGDKVSYELKIDVGKNAGSVFSSNSLGRVNATVGEYFQYSLKDVLLNPNVTVTPSYEPKVDWIKFHSKNNTFTGEVPKNFKRAKITLTAHRDKERRDSNNEETTSLTLTGVPATSKDKDPSSSESGSGKGGDDDNNDTGPSKRTIAIICGTVIPICVLAAIGFLLLCCYRSRKAKSSEGEADESPSSSHRNISPPILPEVTRVSDPEKGESHYSSSEYDDDNTHWDTPQKVLALNFMKMDSSGEDLNNNHYYSSEETHVADGVSSYNSPSLGGNSPAVSSGKSPALTGEKHVESPLGLRGPQMENSSSPTPNKTAPPTTTATTAATATATTATAATATAVAISAPSDDDKKDIKKEEQGEGEEEGENRAFVRPRNSWRHATQTTDPNEGGRWQEHNSVGSLATISTDELLTMRLVDRQSHDNIRGTYMAPTKSTILTPHQSFYPRDESSGNIQQLGSHSSSLQQEQNYNIHSHSSSDQSSEGKYNNMKRVPGSEEVDVDYYRDAMQRSSTNFQSDEDEGQDLYRTASSGTATTTSQKHLADDDASYKSSDQESLRPYRNSRGEMTWSKRSIDQTSNRTELVSYPGAESTMDYENDDSRQSYGLAITTPDREGGTISSSSHQRDTLRLVQHPEMSNLRDLRTPDIEETPDDVESGKSAELAFL